MNKYKKVLNSLGHVSVFVAASMLVPMITALCYKEYSELLTFFVTAAVAAILGAGAVRLTKKHARADIGINYSAIIVVAAWLTAILISCFPILISTRLGFTEAFFESSSGWTTTGLTVLNIAAAPKSILIWRSMTQFLGGIGVIFVLQIVLPNPRTAMLYNSEGHSELVLPNIKKTIKIIAVIYLSYTALGLVLYLFGGMSFFDALNHSMTAISTGGFSTKIGSIGAYNSVYIEAVTILLMILGSINFSVHILLYTGKFKAITRFFEMRVYSVIFIIFVPLFVFVGLLPIYGALGHSLRIGVFSAISAMSTTGFTVSGNSAFGGFALICLLVLMLIGGSSGSTSGGLKLYRAGIMSKSFYWNVKSKLMDENKVYQNYVYNASGKLYIKREDVLSNNTFILIYLSLWLLGSLLMSAFGFTLGDSLFEYAGVLSTTGLPYAVNHAVLPDAGLWLIIIGMVIARLECGVIMLAVGKISSDFCKSVKKLTKRKA